MPVFTYRGVNRAGATVAGERAADQQEPKRPRFCKREQDQRQQAFRKGEGVQHPHVRNRRRLEGAGHFHAPVLRDDRRRLAARAVSRDSRRTAGEQDLPEDPERRARFGRRRRHAFRLDEAVRQGLRPPLLQHGGSRRDGRYSGHHSPAALAATSKRTSS